jgi:predicted RNase H-like HicB family nuclease
VAVVFTIETEQEVDGRWLAEVMELPGAVAYGPTHDEAIARVQALALRVVADRLEHGEAGREYLSITFNAASRDRRVAEHQSPARLVRASSHRLDYQTPDGLPYGAMPVGLAQPRVFAFHDREEIGPRMLARLAKRSGLRPEDFQVQRRRMPHSLWAAVRQAVDAGSSTRELQRGQEIGLLSM